MSKSNLEKLCIRVDKVYDWVTRQVEKDFNFVGGEGLDRLNFNGNGTPEDPCDVFNDDEDVLVKVFPTNQDGVKIDPNEIECVEVGERQDVFIEEFDTMMQVVKIKKQGFFVIELSVENNTNNTLVSDPISFCIFEKFVLCAPEGTDVICHVYDFFGDGVLCCNNSDFQDLAVTIVLCQSVQVETEVKVEIEGALCAPREDIILPIPTRVCPEISFPPQCPNVFPPC